MTDQTKVLSLVACPEQEINMANVVTLTDKAVDHFSSVAKGKYVKFGIMGGGCAGFQYHWETLMHQLIIWKEMNKQIMVILHSV